MGSFLARLFGRPDPAAVVADFEGLVEPRVRALLAESLEVALARAIEPVAEASGELHELLQKTARNQARLGLRVEEVERKVEAGFGDLRNQVAASASQSADDFDWSDVLDALDALAQARSHARAAGQEPLAVGLDVITERLGRFLAQGGLARVDHPGDRLDGRVFKVVGSQPHAEIPAGSVVRVVRAAVLAGTQVVREGEVVTSEGPVTAPSV